MTAPSIFNDVLGPVMRGPSSSHSAAALRIGRMARDLMDGQPGKVVVDYDPNGSLVTTHASQGSDMGLFGGLLGFATDDERLLDCASELERAGIEVEIRYLDYGASHPNTYRLHLDNGQREHRLLAISTGGGMIEVLEVDGFPVSFVGDLQETFFYLAEGADTDAIVGSIQDEGLLEEWQLVVNPQDQTSVLHLRSRTPLPADFLAEVDALAEVVAVRTIRPVLGTLGRRDGTVPFLTVADMLRRNEERNLSLWELAAEYESERAGITTDEVLKRMLELVGVWRTAIELGSKGTEFDDRILPSQTVRLQQELAGKRLVGGDVLNQMILYVTALMEVKSSMGVIVAAPTAGSCGACPGAVFAVADALGRSDEDVAKAMLIAGMIGVFVAEHATFAAEVGGCMAECGSGAGMAAAAIVWLADGSLEQSLCASSLALQNSLGMICDPIGNRVEAPCLGRNVLGATNALSCANMALADYQQVVPLDEVIETMQRVGDAIPNELCCTALGGLSTTPTSKRIEADLAQGCSGCGASKVQSKSTAS